MAPPTTPMELTLSFQNLSLPVKLTSKLREGERRSSKKGFFLGKGRRRTTLADLCTLKSGTDTRKTSLAAHSSPVKGVNRLGREGSGDDGKQGAGELHCRTFVVC